MFGHGWIRRAGDAGCFVGGVVEFSPFASVISIGTRESSGKIANDIWGSNTQCMDMVWYSSDCGSDKNMAGRKCFVPS